MADGFRMELTGIKDFQARIKAAPVTIQKEVQTEITAGARDIASEAKQRTSQFSGGYTKGILRNLISSTPAVASSEGFQASIASGAAYSAYVEFGTGEKVQPEFITGIGDDQTGSLAEFAIQFKGTKKIKGQKPQPYFFPAAFRIWPIIRQRISNILDSI